MGGVSFISLFLISSVQGRYMFKIAFLIGAYSYLIFLLGMSGFLYKNFVVLLSYLYILFSLFILRKELIFLKLKDIRKIQLGYIEIFSLILLVMMSAVALIGVFSPELSFDALWYHLTLPKLYLLNHSIYYIPGTLLYYSDMPKLTEMLYIGALSISNEILAKFIHFLFGILTLIAIYKISQKFFSKNISIVVSLVFYSNLVVGWESITAYVDLSRTFFETMAFWGFVNWVESKKIKWLLASAVLVGLAISTKLIALGSLLIFAVLIAYVLFSRKKEIKNVVLHILLYSLVSLIMILPWFVFSFVNTGNPLYPFFDNRIGLAINFTISLKNLVSDIINLFLYSSDPTSPLYLIILPVLIFLFNKASQKVKLLYIYSFCSLLVWFITPKIGGGRFILPYLPVLSLIAVYPLTVTKDKYFKYLILLIIFIIATTSIGYRFLANKKFIPVILGQETKEKFFSSNLNFNFGDFYDTDEYFSKNIKKTDTVLLYGFHNLYYINFPFVDSSWVKKGDRFNYIAVLNSSLPKRFNKWNLIYYNKVSHVKLYTLNKRKWIY